MSSSSDAERIHHIGQLYMFYVGMFNLVIGVIGNAAIILVFRSSKAFRGNQSAIYLTAESISNIGLLTTIYVFHIITFAVGYDPALVSLSWCKMQVTTMQTFGLCSLYSICFLAFDQYLATNLRYSLRQMSTTKLAYHCLFVILCFATAHSMLFLIYTDIGPSMGCTVYHPTVKRYIAFFYIPVLNSLLPLISTVTFSVLAFYNTRHLVRLQVPVVRRRLDRQMTAITLARVISLVIGGTPYILIFLVELNVNPSTDNYVQLATVYLISAICYSWLYTSFSVRPTTVLYWQRRNTSVL